MFNYRTRHNYCGSVFSFGAGTQSTAILLLMKYEKERFMEAVKVFPEYIIFADTGAESIDSLINLEKCKDLFPIIRVKNFKRNADTNPIDVPVYFGKKSMNMQRRCTEEWKIKPITQAIKKIYPKKRTKKPVALMLGISTDEVTRMRENYLKSIQNIYPLIDLNLSRQDCYDILKKYGWESVKSHCYMCPFQSKRWHKNPEIDKAIEYEKRVQALSHYKKTPYLHPSALPLAEVYEQQSAQVDIWNMDNECTGYCGL